MFVILINMKVKQFKSKHRFVGLYSALSMIKIVKWSDRTKNYITPYRKYKANLILLVVVRE